MIQKHTDGRGGNAPSSEKILNGMRKRKRQDMIFAYAVLIFPVLHFIVFWLCMNVSTVFLSFRSGNMQVGEWNNFRNYTGAFKAIFGIDKNEGMIMNWRALLNTLSLIPLSMLINLPITLIFSFAIFRKIKGYTIYRIVLFLPAMISATVLCFVFKMFINGNQAVFNKLLEAMRLEKIIPTKYSSAKITMFGMLKNSLVLIAVCTGLQAIVPVITGYVVARYKTRLGAVAVQLVIISMVVPAIGSTASTYAFMSAIKLKDKWLGIFLMNAGGLGFGMLLYKNYFSSISWEYAESAFLDGAGNLRVFFSIMYPQALPLIVSMAILNVIGLWNDYMTPYLFLNSKPTVALGVYSIQTRAEQSGAMPQAFAAMTFMTVFVLAIYAGFSKTIMSSMSVGGLKG